MARLDASRVAAWRELQSIGAAVERRIDEVLMAEWQVPLGWFDVLAALQQHVSQQLSEGDVGDLRRILGNLATGLAEPASA